MSEAAYDGVPGSSRSGAAFGETTVVVEPARLVEAATHLRDELGFNFLSDISAADYLGWGERGVAGYIGTAAGRDINRPMTQGLERLPEPKPKRFSMSYHLLAIAPERAARAPPGLARRRRAGAERGRASGRRPTGTSARRTT